MNICNVEAGPHHGHGQGHGMGNDTVEHNGANSSAVEHHRNGTHASKPPHSAKPPHSEPSRNPHGKPTGKPGHH